MPFKIMSLTDAAAERINEIIEDSDKPVIGLRVGIKNAGCAGVSYTMDYVEAPIPGDDHVEDHGVNVWVDPKATMYLLGTVMDFEASKMGSSFTSRAAASGWVNASAGTPRSISPPVSASMPQR